MNLKFYSMAYPKFGKEDFVVRMTGEATTERELLLELYYKIKVPGYIGVNWDAFNDFINDLTWLDNYRIIIIQESLPKLQERDLFIYLDILNDAVSNWSKLTEHTLEVYFRSKDRPVIDTIFQDNKK